jgi:hypothetical protein
MSSVILYHKHKYELSEDEWPEWMSHDSNRLEKVWGWSSYWTDDKRFGFETKEEAKQDAQLEGFEVS